MWTLFGFFVKRITVEIIADSVNKLITLFNSKKHESFDLIYCTFKCIQQEVNKSFIKVTLNKT